MNEYRKCENCNAKNFDLTLTECSSCGASILHIMPNDNDDISIVVNLEQNEQFDITCSECGKQYEDNLLTCPSCGAAAKKVPLKPELIIESIKDSYKISIPSGKSIGRLAIGSEYFNKNDFISRKHATFKRSSNEWKICPHSRNPNYLNDTILLKNEIKYPVHKGDLLKIADMEFRIII